MKFFYFITNLLLFLFLSGSAISQDYSFSENKSFPYSKSRWKSNIIPVCWESGAYPEERQWVRNRVTKEYNKTPISFTGWGICPQRFDGIRIGVKDVGPHTLGLGQNLSGVKNGMVLNFTYLNWDPSCQNRKKYCDEVIAVHEFGHAIGLSHEQNRSDTNRTLCTDQPQGSDGDILIGAWDANSIMNYCNISYNNDGKLSKGDIQGIRYLYENMPFSMPFLATTSVPFPSSAKSTYRLEDFNNDGYADLVQVEPLGSDGANIRVISAYPAGGRPFNQIIVATTTTPFPASDYSAYFFTDLNGDGTPDLVQIEPLGSAGANIRAISGRPVEGKPFNQVILATSTVPFPASVDSTYLFADMDKDGTLDLVQVEPLGDIGANIRIISGQYVGGKPFNQVIMATKTVSFPASQNSSYSMHDLNYDGRLDLVQIEPIRKGMNVRLISGEKYFDRILLATSTTELAEIPVEAGDRFIMADLNKDGEFDIAHIQPLGGSSGVNIRFIGKNR